MSLTIEPMEAKFNGPFSSVRKSFHKMTNNGTTKICIKMKTFDAGMVFIKPPITFLKAGETMELMLHHNPFPYAASEDYSHRKVAALYIESPDTATDPVAFAKTVPLDKWRVVKLKVIYVDGPDKTGAKEPETAPTKKSNPQTRSQNQAIRVTPENAEFKVPLTAPCSSEHSITNNGEKKLCIKVKGFDNSLLKIRPPVTFLGPGETVMLSLQHFPFDYQPNMRYDDRKVAIFFTEAPEDDIDAAVFAKQCTEANWTVAVKLLIKYAS